MSNAVCPPNGMTPISISSWTAAAEQPGGDEDERHAGPAEERVEVDPARAVIEPDAQDSRDGDPEQRTDEDPDRATLCGRGRGLSGQEQGRLDALADDRDEREHAEGRRRSVVDGAVNGRMEFALDTASLAAHPEQHPGHDGCRRDHGDALEQLLVRLFEAADGGEQDDPEEGAQRDRQAGPDEDLGERAAVPGLGQVGEDDRHDERRLDTLPQAGQQSTGKGAEIHRVGVSCFGKAA